VNNFIKMQKIKIDSYPEMFDSPNQKQCNKRNSGVLVHYSNYWASIANSGIHRRNFIIHGLKEYR